ncbi:helix-turn-helix domain-containing protein [Streptomyces sp. NPDC048603]|uniref:helix-turn-helix domain-containing protein n=1 Tax=Streptomyces sp. NPDC048603 TaxID=3365577 RepID=UPI0037184FD2
MSSPARSRRVVAVPSSQVSPLSETFLDVKAAARHLGMDNERFVRRLVAERRIPYSKFGTHVRIKASVLEEYMRQNEVPALVPRSRTRRAA